VASRWESPDEPDEQGVQLAAIQHFLVAHSEVQLVWYDYWCASRAHALRRSPSLLTTP
jgi:hypothetical protein